MTVYLLDVNLLLALSDPMHVHHELDDLNAPRHYKLLQDKLIGVLQSGNIIHHYGLGASLGVE